MLSGHPKLARRDTVLTISSLAIPGSVPSPSKEVLYVEHAGSEKEWAQRFDEAGEKAWSLGPPTNGGMITQNVALTTPDGVRFFSLSYRGDVPAWRRGITTYASEMGLRTAVVEGGNLQGSDGSVWPLNSCAVTEYESPNPRGRRRGGS